MIKNKKYQQDDIIFSKIYKEYSLNDCAILFKFFRRGEDSKMVYIYIYVLNNI